MDGYTKMVRDRAERSNEFYNLRLEQAKSYLATGQADDRETACYILRDQLGIADDEVRRLVAESRRVVV